MSFSCPEVASRIRCDPAGPAGRAVLRARRALHWAPPSAPAAPPPGPAPSTEVCKHRADDRHAEGRRGRSPSPLFFKNGAFYVQHERGDGHPRGAVARCRGRLSRWYALHCPRRRGAARRRHPRRRGRRPDATRWPTLAALPGPMARELPARRCLAFLAKFLRLKFFLGLRRRASLSLLSPALSPAVLAAARCVGRVDRASQTRHPRRHRPDGKGDWEAVEAIVRLVLGRTMDDLVQRVAQMFVKEPPMVVAAPLPLPAPPSALALVRPQQRSPAVEDKRGAVAKSEMVLVSPKTASSAVGAGSAGKSRSHPVATSPKARISKPGQCRCRDSRDQIERLSMTWASSGDSSDVHPTANKPADSQVAVVPSRYSSVVDRPPWRHSFRTPSDVRTPGWSGPSRATPPVSPLASPRQRKDVVQKKGKATEQAAGAHERARGDALADARGDAPAPDSAPAAAAHARSKVNIKSTASRIHHHQSSVQVLYETPPRPQPAPAHGHLVSPASPRPCQQQQRRAGTEIKVVKEAEAQGPLKPALSEAETQTHGAPGSGPCCRSVMNQVQELRNLITGLQRTLSQLGQDAKQRDTEADRCRQGVEFWQKRYEDLREELVRCQRAQNNLLIKSKPNDGYS